MPLSRYDAVCGPRLRRAAGALVAAVCFAELGYGQAAAPVAPAGGSPLWSGGVAPGGAAEPSGLLAPRRAPAGNGWLSTPTPPDAFSPVQGRQPSYITPEPMTPHRADAIYLDELAPPAPPEIRVAGLAEETVAPLNQMSPEPQGPLPPGARDGVFQKIYFTGTWLPAIEDEPDTLGAGELETGVVLGFPFMRRDTPLLVTPQFGVHFLENAAALDVPSTLYDGAIDFRHLRKFGGGPWAMDVGATVGYYSDLDQGSSEAVRVTGRGLAVYEASPQTKWILGVAYLNRAGASVLPVAGVIYEPTPTTRVDLIFPRPRFSWQTAASAPGDERWLYVGGEFGGGVWSVTRPSTAELDVINYSDWRLMGGYERKVAGGLSYRVEGGYVFNRELEYDSATPDVSLDDTVFLRSGVTY